MGFDKGIERLAKILKAAETYLSGLDEYPDYPPEFKEYLRRRRKEIKQAGAEKFSKLTEIADELVEKAKELESYIDEQMKGIEAEASKYHDSDNPPDPGWDPSWN